MVMTIPDSGNITGSQPVLRQQSAVTPMSDTRVVPMDVTPVADSLENLGKAYKQFKEQENLAFGQQLFNDYNEHIAKFQMDWENSHKKYAARDYYQALKEESWKFYNDRTGAPKDDGKIRTNDPDQKAAFQTYIEKRQPSLISHAMAYEANELTQAQNESFDAGESAAAIRILSGDPIEIANGLADLDRITAIRQRGADSDYIRLQQAQKRDVAVSGLVMQTANTDPVAAAKLMDRGRYPDGRPIGNPQVYDNLTSATEAKLRAAIKEAAGPKFEADELIGEGPTLEDIMYTYNPKNLVEAKMIQADISNKALKKKATIDKEAADARASQISDMRDNVFYAKTPEEKQEALIRFADRYPAEAQRVMEMQSLINQDMAAEKLIDDYDLEDFDEYVDIPEISPEVRVLVDPAFSDEDLEQVAKTGKLKGKPVTPSVAVYAKQALEYRRATNIKKAQQEAIFQRSPISGQEPLTEVQINMIKEYMQRGQDRIKNMDQANDALRRVNQGENISNEELMKFDPATINALVDGHRNIQDFDAMSAKLRMGGVNLEQLMLDTSYADFKNNPGKQITIKSELTKYINEYQNKEGGYPTEDTLKRMIDSAIANSKTKSDSVSAVIDKKYMVRFADEVERQILNQKTSGKTDATSFDNRYEKAKDAIKEAMSEMSVPQHVRQLINKNMDSAIYSVMSGQTQNFFGNLLRGY